MEHRNVESFLVESALDSITASTGTLTPTSSVFEFQDNEKALIETWHKAVEKCKKSLTPADFAAIQRFETAESLANDLERRQAEYAKGWTVRSILPVAPTLQALSTATWFLGACMPASVEKVFIWGVLHLSIRLSLSSQQTWEHFITMLNTIRKKLELLNRYASLFQNHDDSDEMHICLVDVFVTLIEFWVQAANWFRSNALKQATKEASKWPELHQGFENAMHKVEATLKHLFDLLEFRRFSDEKARKLDQETRLLKNINLSDESGTFPCRMLPQAPYTGFLGRKDTLETIRKHLDPSENLHQLKSILLHGIGGVGKTEIALTYAHTFAASFDVISWIQSETAEALRQSFSKAAFELELPGTRIEGSDESNMLIFHKWMRQQADRNHGRKWLLIFDNVESIDDIDPKYMPVTPGSVLLTSRHHDVKLKDTRPLEIKPFAVAESFVLFKQILNDNHSTLVKKEDDDAVLQLVKSVDGLALGLRQLAALIDCHGLTIPLFCEKYKRNAHRIRNSARNVQGYGHTLDTVWRMSFDQLEPDTTSLLAIMAFLSPDAISEKLFHVDKDCDDRVGEESHVNKASYLPICEDEFIFDTAARELRRASLIGRNNDALSMHRLVQEAFLYGLSPKERQKYFDAAVSIVEKVFPRQVNGNPFHNRWEECRAAIQHGMSLANRFAELKRFKLSLNPSAAFVELLKNCARYLFEMSDYYSSLKLLEIAYSACQDKDSILYAHLKNIECASYFEMNDTRKAKEANNIALKIREALYIQMPEEIDQEYANSLNNAGCIEAAEGRVDEALALFSRAEAIRVSLGKKVIVPLGLTYMTSGRALFLKQQYAEAIHRYNMAEKIFIRAFGPKGHFMAHLNYAWGNLEYAREDQRSAKRYYESALQILRERSPTHMLLSACLYKVACIESWQGDPKKAMALLEEALAIAENANAKGDQARILRKQALIEADLTGNAASFEAINLKLLADTIRANLPEQSSAIGGNTDEQWDSLVCGYWR